MQRRTPPGLGPHVVFAALAALAGCGGTTLPSPMDGGTSQDGARPDGSTTDGATTDYFACTGPAQCTLVDATCCGVCGVPQAKDKVALNAKYERAYREGVCSEPVACPDCIQGDNAALVAACVSGRCRVVDLSTSPLAQCATDVDCRLRNEDCCECPVTPDRLVAIATSQSGAYHDMVCTGTEGCSKCLPTFPPGVGAVCDPKTKHCAVADKGG